MEPGTEPPKAEKKLELLPSPDGDTCITFKINDEDHTLGNALRYIIMKNPDTEFCGYTIPHPSENCIKLRIQTREGVTAVDVLAKGLRDLDRLCGHVEQVFVQTVHDYRSTMQ